MTDQATHQMNKVCYKNGRFTKQRDVLIVEQPLSLNLCVNSSTGEEVYQQLYWLTLRTPGQDKFLITGYLLSQGVIREQADIVDIILGSVDDVNVNAWQVTLSSACYSRLNKADKMHVASASCGLCGSTSLKVLELNNPPKPSETTNWLNPEQVFSLINQLTKHQAYYLQTGGVHGAALFSAKGDLIAVNEDIGRHNALDKLLGQRFIQQNMQAEQQIVVMSSRASFDILQKVVMSGIEILITVGAPSDLALKTAQRFGITLIGFVKHNSFNIYHDERRIAST